MARGSWRKNWVVVEKWNKWKQHREFKRHKCKKQSRISGRKRQNSWKGKGKCGGRLKERSFLRLFSGGSNISSPMLTILCTSIALKRQSLIFVKPLKMSSNLSILCGKLQLKALLHQLIVRLLLTLMFWPSTSIHHIPK